MQARDGAEARLSLDRRSEDNEVSVAGPGTLRTLGLAREDLQVGVARGGAAAAVAGCAGLHRPGGQGRHGGGAGAAGREGGGARQEQEAGPHQGRVRVLRRVRATPLLVRRRPAQNIMRTFNSTLHIKK